MVWFAGWDMPIQYTSIIDEHMAVRQRSGAFDVSHMGEAEIRGTEAVSFLDRMLTNSVAAKEVVLKQERFPPARITVIANSIADINKGLADSPAGDDASPVIVGMVANPRPVKRVDRFSTAP